jgi:uracil-DNA glycosylase
MNWDTALAEERQKDYYKNLHAFLQDEYDKNTIYPPVDCIMKALELTSLDNVKVVILGQDPYHQPGQAMGLSFSVPTGTSVPRSLQNIYRELHTEYNCYIPDNGDLTPWAKQGVLLLNSVLTVRENTPGSHAHRGWELYTNQILRVLNTQERPIVYMLWGNYAKAKQSLITNKRHLVLTAAHPSPFSANNGFFGCGHFKKCNEYLMTCGLQPINWQIENA